jgi:hypothetical protein
LRRSKLLQQTGLASWDFVGSGFATGPAAECYRSVPFSPTIGNQQSRPDAALAERVVNAVGATLLSKCLERGIDPEGPNAPQSMR